MSNLTDFQEKLHEIMAIPDQEVQSPYMPLDHYMLEAEGTRVQALKDIKELVNAGIPEDLVYDLAKRVGACRQAQSNWVDSQHQPEEAEKRWNKLLKIGIRLRKKLFRAFRYAYRKNSDLIRQVSYISKDTGNADLIQDLNDLSTMGRNNPEPLKAINFDMELLDQAADLSDEMSELLNVANGERYSDDEARIFRDKAYTFLKFAVDEIRDCGKYLFWDDPERLRYYTSEYLRKHRHASSEDEEPEMPEEMEDSPDET
jgi:hypothetical protein